MSSAVDAVPVALDRRYVLAGVAAFIAVIAAAVLREILATVFFAITVAYILAPVDRWFRRRGLSPWWSSAATTVVAFLGLFVVLSPLLVVAYLRSEQMIGLIEQIPQETTVTAFGRTETIDATEIRPLIIEYVEGLLISLGQATPTLAIKLTVFLLVMYALLTERTYLHTTLLGLVPGDYREFAMAMAGRARDTLYAIYILQAATAVVAFLLAVPLYYALGYQFPFALAVVTGMFQFVPIVGPSVVVLAVAAFDLALGEPNRAILVATVGLVVLAWLPDPLVRPRLARHTADMPGSVYFIGFTGGLFTLGVVGIIAGPLIVGLVDEAVDQLQAEMSDYEPDAALGQSRVGVGATVRTEAGAERLLPGQGAGDAPDAPDATDADRDAEATDDEATDPPDGG